MSAIANITVFDGAATPVSHTLVAISVTREKSKITAEWREKLSTLPDNAQVAAFATLEKLKSGTIKTELRTEVPTMEAVLNQNAAGYTAAPKIAYVDTMLSTAFNHPRSSVTGRRLGRQLHVNLMGNISTSVAPVTTGPMPELFDQWVSVT